MTLKELTGWIFLAAYSLVAGIILPIAIYINLYTHFGWGVALVGTLLYFKAIS